jgi:Flp pilus assembly protein TadG
MRKSRPIPTPRRTHRQRGATLLEFAIVAPIAILVILALVQLGLAMVAKQILNEAAFEGARLGATEHSVKTEVLRGIERKMLPFYTDATKPSDVANMAAALAAQTADLAVPTTLTVDRLSPPATAFQDFGLSTTDSSGNQVVAIPNDNLEFRSYANVKGASSQLTIQDANELRLRVTYALEIKVPLMKVVFQSVMCGVGSGVEAFGLSGTGIPGETANGDCLKYWSRGRMPITVYATVQMQSDVYQDSW